jgi:TetR/AcrR family transcriptional regulator
MSVKTPPPDLARQLLDVSDRILNTDPAPRLEDVARLVGASRATLYYYFSGRDDLLTFLLTTHAKHGAQAVQAAVNTGDAVTKRLQTMLEAMVAFLGQHPGMCAGLLAALGGSGRMQDVLAANDTWIAGPLRDVLVEGQAAGEFAFDSVADSANAILGALLLAVLGRSMSGGDAADPVFQKEITRQLVRGVSSGRSPRRAR